MKYRWVMRPCTKPDVVAHLRPALNNIPESLVNILVNRGVETFEQARAFFRPSPELFYDPFLMRDMDLAVARIVQAIENEERILVYGDYDVDGTTSTALMTAFLRGLGLDTLYYIPDRQTDGYGLGPTGIDLAYHGKVNLIIALDCGITAHEEALYVKERGLDLIICDHHTVKETIPEAVAVLNPKRPDCDYPYEELSACGVGFKLIEAVAQHLDLPPETAHAYLDLVALSIASDIVPMVDENRMLMHKGLEILQNNPRVGLYKLATHANLDLSRCGTSNIVFSIGPRINAAGRMGDAKRAVALMIEDDPWEATKLAEELERANNRRRQLDKNTFDHAIELAEQSFETCNEDALVLYHPEWHIGVIGIVASRLVERFHRPTVLLTSINGEVRGSARSLGGFNIYNALKACEPLLTQFGGHAFAAGVALEEANVAVFCKELNRVVHETISPDQLKPELYVDAALPLRDITASFWNVLRQFAPFGPHNRNPVFIGENLRVVGSPTIVGNGHLKFRVTQADAGPGQVFDVIGFGLHEFLPLARASRHEGGGLDMLFSVEENTWRGQTTLQLRARDLRPAQAQIADAA